ncbi:MAG: NAD(P)-binding domain-containing protein, partial [Candidatus Nitrosotenuis sp.]
MSLQQTLEKIKQKSCVVEIFGLGYVGFPLSIKLASSGFTVTGVDVNLKRVERLKNDHLMDSEIYLKDEFLKCKKEGRLHITDVPVKSDLPKIGMICVPTPIPSEHVSSDVYVKSAVETFLKYSKKGDVIILESSIEVGTTEVIKE